MGEDIRCGEEKTVFVGLVISNHIVVVEEPDLQQGGVGTETHVPGEDKGNNLHEKRKGKNSEWRKRERKWKYHEHKFQRC